MPAQNLGRGGRGNIAVVAEKARLPFLPQTPALEQWMGWLILGREHQRHVEAGAEIRGRHELLGGEVLDAENTHRPSDIAQVWPRQFIAGWPGRQHPGHGIARLDEVL